MSVKVSKWRQTTSKLAKPEAHILNVNPSGAIWDGSNMMTTNGKYLAVPWKNPGSVVILPCDFQGKLPTNPTTMLTGHQGNVIDCAFNPFADDLLFTGSEDCSVKGWRIPEGGNVTDATEPVVTLQGHGKKVGILTFHHAAANVLATAGFDNTVNLWDIEVGKPAASFKDAGDQIMSLNFNLDGSLFNTTTKDKKVNIHDSRSGAVVGTALSHEGSKAQRSVWAKRRGLIVTLGFNSSQYRELKVWDIRNMAKAVAEKELDQQTGVMMPFMDEDTGMLYVGGKGDGGIKYFDLWEDDCPVVALNAFQSTEATKGLAMVPKKFMDVRSCEVARFFKMTTKAIMPISFNLPRKACDVEFQEDVFPPTFADEPAIDAAAFFSGVNSTPRVQDLRALFDRAPLKPSSPTGSPATAAQMSRETSSASASEGGSPASQPSSSNNRARAQTTVVAPKQEEPAKPASTTPPPQASTSAPAKSPVEPVSPTTPPTPVSSPAVPVKNVAAPSGPTISTTGVADAEVIRLQGLVDYLTAELASAKQRLAKAQAQQSENASRAGTSTEVDFSSPVSLGSPTAPREVTEDPDSPLNVPEKKKQLEDSDL
jgi:coronin-1B/1C/6